MKYAHPYWKRSARLLQNILRARPAICTLQVSNRCNMKCSFCSFWSDGASPNEEISLEEIATLSEKLAQIGSFILSVEGGEPMLRPDIIEIVRQLARYHHPVLYTNGWFITESNAKKLWQAGLLQVGISLDYATPDKHDQNRLPASFSRVLHAVKCFQKTAKNPERQIHLMTVLMKDNLDEIEPLLELSKRLKIRHRLTLLSIEGHNRAESKKLPKPEISSWLLTLKKRYSHLVNPTSYIKNLDAFLSGTYRAPCQAGKMGFNINHKGETNPCIEFANLSSGKFLQIPNQEILSRLSSLEETKNCQRCYTLCRGHVQLLSRPLSLRALLELLL